MMDSGTLARLVALGRRKGHLTNQDLEEALPVDTMSAEDIALVVVHLEEAGVSVELDESLLARATPGGPRRSRHPEVVLPADGIGTSAPPGPDRALSPAEAPAAGEGRRSGRRGGPSAHKAVLLAILLILILALLALALNS